VILLSWLVASIGLCQDCNLKTSVLVGEKSWVLLSSGFSVQIADTALHSSCFGPFRRNSNCLGLQCQLVCVSR